MGWLSKIFNPASIFTDNQILAGPKAVNNAIDDAGSLINDFTKQSLSAIGRNPLGLFIDPIVGDKLLGLGDSLISPTGNWSQATWDDMYANANEDKKRTLDKFRSVNKVADVIAPIIAGGYAAGSGLFAGGAAGGAGAGGMAGGGGLGTAGGFIGADTMGAIGSSMGSALGGAAAPVVGGIAGGLGTGAGLGVGSGLLGALGGAAAGSIVNNTGGTSGSGAGPNNVVDPNLPTVTVTGNKPPVPLGGSGGLGGLLPAVTGLAPTVFPNGGLTQAQLDLLQNPPPVQVAQPPATNLPNIPSVPTFGNGGQGGGARPAGSGGGNGGGGGSGGNTIKDIINGLGGLGGLFGGGSGGGLGGLGNLASLLYGAYSKNNMGDSFEGILNEMRGMYKPGTPEYDDMRNRIEARDAAAGRRSQYGPRERELAANMADSRMKMLSSPGFMNMQAAMLNNQPSTGGLSELFGSLANNGANSLGGMLGSLFDNWSWGDDDDDDTPSNELF